MNDFHISNTHSDHKKHLSLSYLTEDQKLGHMLWKQFYDNENIFHNRLQVLENMTVVVKTIFKDLQAFKTRINRHDEEKRT